MSKCIYCGALIRDDESTCDSLYCGPKCGTCDNKGWIPAKWLSNKKDAESYPKLRQPCPDCQGG